MLRAMMQAHFDRRSDQERTVDVRGSDGVERAQTRRGSRTVMTEFGEIELERNLYQAPSALGLAPLDAVMELPDEISPHSEQRGRRQVGATSTTNPLASKPTSRHARSMPFPW